MRKTVMLICSMEPYLDCLNLLLALFSQFRLKILKAGVIQLSVPELKDLKPGSA